MKVDDFRLSISFPKSLDIEQQAQVSICWKTKALFSITVSANEFVLALSSLQFRPAIQIDFNYEILKRFMSVLSEEQKLLKIKVYNSSSQKETKTTAVGISDLGTIVFTTDYWEFGLKQYNALAREYPDVAILLDRGIHTKVYPHE